MNRLREFLTAKRWTIVYAGGMWHAGPTRRLRLNKPHPQFGPVDEQAAIDRAEKLNQLILDFNGK